MLAGWAILGVAVGAVATELLRARNPRLVKKVEGAAKRFVDSFYPSRPADEEAAEETKDTPRADD